MFWDNELAFLCDTLKKLHLRASSVGVDMPVGAVLDTDIYSVFGRAFQSDMTVGEFVGELDERTLYIASDALHLCYIYFLLPKREKPTLLFIGPYLSYPIIADKLLGSGSHISVSAKSRRYISEYYAQIPVLEQNSAAIAMINTFCERVWESPSFSIAEIINGSRQTPMPLQENGGEYSESFDATLMNIKAMENRYNFENELIEAVSLGQIHKESQLLAAFSEPLFERRAQDVLRNAKNYGVIMNTLLRKAAEKGGVHPVYLDKISSEFAVKIENMTDLSENFSLMREMFRSYCRLVRKHTVMQYSLVVQKTVLIIDADISADMSLATLAAGIKVSPGYLATLFKKETGMTVSEYIRRKRIAYATHLLVTTQMQIQAVALKCGIVDVQYFSKIFKKETGKTPKEYRESEKQNNNR